MHFGGAMFFTDYSMSAPELARALEERGFESVWAPEHPASCHELDRVRPPRLGRPLRVALPQELFTLEPGFAIP